MPWPDELVRRYGDAFTRLTPTTSGAAGGCTVCSRRRWDEQVILRADRDRRLPDAYLSAVGRTADFVFTRRA